MADKRGRYSTRQQEAVLAFLRSHAGESLTVDEIHHDLLDGRESVGKTTVYRSLERLSSEGSVVQVPDAEGGPARYCLVDGPVGSTCLVCLACHRVFPLACEGLETFVHHVSVEHAFELEPRRTVLYGYCESCSRGRHTSGVVGAGR